MHPFLIRRGGIDSKHETANTPFYRWLVIHMLMTDAGKESVFKEKVYLKYTEFLKINSTAYLKGGGSGLTFLTPS
ncbi:hypothetical protein GGR98_002271 [Parageobacillus caldoxylosilyticus]|nr:hypothetical protein [Parageobacillus caldoxylosilyticus]